MAYINTRTTTSRRPRTSYGDRLAYSCCRLNGASKEFPSLCPVFIASNECGIFLCRVEPPLQGPCAVDTTLSFDTSVQLIHLSQDNSSVENSLLDLLQAISHRKFRISFHSTESNQSSSSKEKQLSGCHSPIHQVQVVTRHEPLDRHSRESNFCAIPLISCVVPLLSISIRPNAEPGIPEPGITCSHTAALQSASIKRQLAGVHVAFREGKFSSSLLITQFNGSQVKYTVDAVSAKGRDPNVRTNCFLRVLYGRLMQCVDVCDICVAASVLR
jgi:hypothetical protein